MYKIIKNMFGDEFAVLKQDEKKYIPFDASNTDYQIYLKWLAEGNTPLPADEPVQEPAPEQETANP